MRPLIIEAAINGATSKATNPHVPRTVGESAPCTCPCFDAGGGHRAAQGRAAPTRSRTASACAPARHGSPTAPTPRVTSSSVEPCT